ncbi:LacI family DNA-binding transcriptional regulator [Ciceribacter sp. L1K23]|uniref:LacI family DNA-binding transcriptional regulator n=1 Tax=Ciceribacter sp. L1K23 TaxID=2820276 RepID=UPI001B815CD7|nr:LacI family DNA-binding transcriptional regulator [Ciceribacter sp. L1K23]MBR0555886.1 LacI family DNA-binding transcriptional regulator [Ciceribacter sp. L1K23]
MTTIYDVADAAGVSPKTVSRVLNGDGPVNEKTRALVTETIRRLNYVPSQAARMMRLQKSGVVGVVTGAISGDATDIAGGLPELYILQGVQRVLSAAGKIAMIADIGDDEDRVPALMRSFSERRVEGLILISGHHRQVSLPPVSAGVPVVLANCFYGGGIAAVVPDDEAGQREGVTGLIDRGHRRIAFLTLPEGSLAARMRTEGYRSALAAGGLPFDPRLVLAAPDVGAGDDALGAALDRLLSGEAPPTALCCGNDHLAMRVGGLLQKRGRRIPEDLSILGFDDHRLITEHLHPRLASVELPYAAIGKRAAERLLERIADVGIAGSAAAVERLVGPVHWRESVRTLK